MSNYSAWNIYRLSICAEMNVCDFDEALAVLGNEVPHRLCPGKIALIQHSLIVLQTENKFDNIYFWGRIDGVDNDYFIAFGYMNDLLSDRRYFYSHDCVDWFLLETWGNYKASEWRCSDYAWNTLQGNASFIHQIAIVSNAQILHTRRDARFQFSFKDSENKKFVEVKEDALLGNIVMSISDECFVVPRGAIFKRIDNRTISNPAFRGLDLVQSGKLINYQLLRRPQYKWNFNLLKRSDYNYATDFLDTLDCIVPSDGSFAIRVDHLIGAVFIKSLHWPGTIFFHKCNTPFHGLVYFGTGRKNSDLLFML